MRSHLACSLLLLLFSSSVPAVAQVADEEAETNDATTASPPARSNTGPAWLGVMLQSDPGPNGGVIVSRPIPGSPAMAAGVPRGAEVMSLNGHAPLNSQDFVTTISELGAGSRLEMQIFGQQEPVVLTLALRPEGRVDLAALTVGTSPADMSVDIVGQTESAALLAGGSVNVVEFWATWCGPCHVALPSLRTLRARYSDDDLRMLSVSEEEEETIASFLQGNPMPWQVATDPEGLITAEFWVESYPMWVVIDRSGVVRGVFRGLNEWIELEQLIASLVAEPNGPTAD